MNPYPKVIVLFAVSIACASGQYQRLASAPSPRIRLARVHTSWTVFQHPRFGYELPIPPGVKALGRPEEAATPKFVSADGFFEMSARGGMFRGYPAELVEAQWRLAHRQGGREITYQLKGSSWFVVSGTDKAGIEFYEKFMIRGQQVAVLSVRFPRSRLREFEPWVEKIEDGFRPVVLRAGSPEMAPRSLHDQDDRPAEKETTSEPRRSESAQQRTTLPKSAESLPKTPPQAEEPLFTANPPTAAKIAGKSGFVFSPFSSDNRMVDVAGIPSGTKVKCPYTMKIFRVP